MTRGRAALAFGAAILATPAAADPCRFIPDRGPMPSQLAPGRTFSGPVVYVGDGDSLCVDVGSDFPGLENRGDQWAEVRLADFYAPELAEPGGPEARDALARIAKGRRVECVAGRRTYDRVAAACSFRGVSLGDLMRRAGIREGGRGR